MQTFEHWGQVGVDGNWSHGRILTDGELQEEGGNADEEQHDRIWYKESTSTMFEAQVRKSPHIAKTFVVFVGPYKLQYQRNIQCKLIYSTKE